MLRRTAAAISAASRRRKFRTFMDIVRPTESMRVLDIGVANSGFGSGGWPTENFFELFYPWPHRITAVGLHDFSRFRDAYPAVHGIRADARKLPFADRSFDIAFSNAVVEHVGTRDDQAHFVSEACRVARVVFMTTPNRWFPVEVHTRLPLVHWFRKPARDALYRIARKPWAQELELLSAKEFLGLFPARTRLLDGGMNLVVLAES